jgi:TrmH family RNA methyltransferase
MIKRRNVPSAFSFFEKSLYSPSKKMDLLKLKRLPRSLRLRKIVARFGEIEHRLLGGVKVEEPEIREAGALLGLLKQDEGLSRQTHRALAEAEGVFRPGNEGFLRSLNALRHALLTETGKSPADWDFIDPAGDLDPRKRRAFPGMTAYLEDIRAPFNVGAMFRGAEAFGAERLFLSPFCADPNHPRAARTARGCTKILPWERLAERGFIETAPGPIFALETGGFPLEEFPFPAQGLLIVGSEELGVSPQALTAADESLGRVSIPTCGAKGSLNAAVAFGIAMYAWSQALLKLQENR